MPSVLEQAADIGDVTEEDFLDARSQALIDVYEAAEKKIVDILKQAEGVSDEARWRYERLLAQIQHEINFLNQSVATWAPAAAKLAYKRGSVFASQTARSMGLPAQTIDFDSMLHKGAISALSDQMALDMLEANETMLNNSTRLIRATQQRVLSETTINRALAEGLAGGESRRQISRTLEKQFAAQIEEGKLITAGGRNFQPGPYAELVTRTRTREAASWGTINTQADYGLDLVQVSTHESEVDVCTPYAGRIFSLGGNNPDFPMLDRRPPFHPNCKHVLMPVSASILKMRGQYEALSALSNNRPSSDDLADIKDWAEKNPGLVIGSTQDYHRYLNSGDATKGSSRAPSRKVSDTFEARTFEEALVEQAAPSIGQPIPRKRNRK